QNAHGKNYAIGVSCQGLRPYFFPNQPARARVGAPEGERDLSGRRHGVRRLIPEKQGGTGVSPV
ncbi:MAG: hypothetical protein ACKOF3_10580, partial [Spartobacteria bacterium]